MSSITDSLKETISEHSEIIVGNEAYQYIGIGTEAIQTSDQIQQNDIYIVKVATTNEIKSLLDLAINNNKSETERFIIYPISSGNNWGYGSSIPPHLTAHVVILDLSLLQGIHFNEQSGLVTIQPGVTQQILRNYLDRHDYNYMVPVTGAGPECSIVSNAIERGYGITPYADHFSAVNSLKGYWADGSPYASAVYELDENKQSCDIKGAMLSNVDSSFKWGVGPHMDGLFTQSNLGIVHEMTIRLAKRKPNFISFFIKVDDKDKFDQSVDKIQYLLQTYEGIIGSINLMDKRRVLSMLAENPNGSEHHNVMTEQQVNELAKEHDIPEWTIIGTVYGTEAVTNAVKCDIKKQFKGLSSQTLCSDSFLLTFARCLLDFLPEWLKNLLPIFNKISSQIHSFDLGQEIMLGIPNKVALKLAYWRHAQTFSAAHNRHPDKDNCGLLWYAPLIPMNAIAMDNFVKFVREVCPKYGIEPFVTFTNLKHDCVDSTVPIVFDQSNPEAVKNAHDCVDELVSKGLKQGYVPYRLNIKQQQTLLNPESDFWTKVSQLKATIDPADILSPRRYNPRA